MNGSVFLSRRLSTHLYDYDGGGGSSPGRSAAIQSFLITWVNSDIRAVRARAPSNTTRISLSLNVIDLCKVLHTPHPPAPVRCSALPTETAARSGCFHPLDQRGSRDGGGVASADAGQAATINCRPRRSSMPKNCSTAEQSRWLESMPRSTSIIYGSR